MTEERHLSPGLLGEISAQCERSIIGGDLSALTDKIKHDFEGSLCAIILYGSCLRSHNFNEGVVDIYVIVSTYREAYRSRFLCLINSALPPNVFYFESGLGENKVRAKYAVISIQDLERGATKWFHSYIWSRFAQPVRLIYCLDDDTRSLIYQSLAGAVVHFLKKTIPALGPGRFDAETIWEHGLGLTYAAELRPEQQNRAKHITHQGMGDFIRLTKSASSILPDLLQALPEGYYQASVSNREKRRCLLQWRLRNWQGRILSVLRLMKAVFTFKDCVDYAAWKIKRHTGITIEVTPVLQKHPILFGFNILWRLLKRDVLH